MRRLTSVFGGTAKPPTGTQSGLKKNGIRHVSGGNPDSNTLLSDMTTVICLDDYHSLDRTGRKEKNVTALAPEAQNFDLMYEQVKAIKEGKAIDKPIYNHVTGLLDPPETIDPPKVNTISVRFVLTLNVRFLSSRVCIHSMTNASVIYAISRFTWIFRMT